MVRNLERGASWRKTARLIAKRTTLVSFHRSVTGAQSLLLMKWCHHLGNTGMRAALPAWTAAYRFPLGTSTSTMECPTATPMSTHVRVWYAPRARNRYPADASTSAASDTTLSIFYAPHATNCYRRRHSSCMRPNHTVPSVC